MGGLNLLTHARSLGLQVYRRGDQVVIRGAKCFADLAQRLIAQKAEILPHLPLEAPADDWRADLATWPLRKHARWSAKAAVLEVLDGLPRDQADLVAYDTLRGTPVHRDDGGTSGPFRQFTLVVSGDAPGGVEGILAEAEALIELLNRRWGESDDQGAAAAALRLEEKIEELRRHGVESWLAS
jgi:hypothetical protein